MASYLDAEASNIIAVLRAEERKVTVILLIPSHDRKQRELKDQSTWYDNAMTLFADLFGGATSFRALEGVFLVEKSNTILRDKPILVESYTSVAKIEDPERLNRLLEFVKRMGRETRQEAVALVVNDYMHFISKFRQTTN